MGFWADRLDAMVAGTESGAPFLKVLILPALVKWEPGKAWFEWPVDQRTHNYAGVVFGGQIALMADRALAITSITALDDEEHFTTSDLRTSFFRPVVEGTLYIEGTVVHKGRRLVHAEAAFTNDSGKLVAKAVAVQHIIPRTVAFDEGGIES
jgi:uncharacterized protein (TIGR00369 family)